MLTNPSSQTHLLSTLDRLRPRGFSIPSIPQRGPCLALIQSHLPPGGSMGPRGHSLWGPTPYPKTTVQVPTSPEFPARMTSSSLPGSTQPLGSILPRWTTTPAGVVAQGQHRYRAGESTRSAHLPSLSSAQGRGASQEPAVLFGFLPQVL